jgi:hypothetical protein
VVLVLVAVAMLTVLVLVAVAMFTVLEAVALLTVLCPPDLGGRGRDRVCRNRSFRCGVAF